MGHGKRLKDIYKNIDGKIISESNEQVIKDYKSTSIDTPRTEADLTGTGLGIHTSNPIGSSAVTMQIDLPSIITLNKKIEEETTNIKNIKKFLKNVLNIQKNFKGLNGDNKSKEAAKKLIESVRKARQK